jgi:hypothetical protein
MNQELGIMKKKMPKMQAPAPANRMVKAGQTRTRATAIQVPSPLYYPMGEGRVRAALFLCALCALWARQSPAAVIVGTGLVGTTGQGLYAPLVFLPQSNPLILSNGNLAFGVNYTIQLTNGGFTNTIVAGNYTVRQGPYSITATVPDTINLLYLTNILTGGVYSNYIYQAAPNVYGTKCDSNDLVAGFLSSKFLNTPGITWVVTNIGANEQITLSNASGVLSTNATNFAQTIGSTLTNWAGVLSTNATNFTGTLSTNATNFAQTIGTTSSNVFQWGNTTLSNLAGLANAAGALTNNGSGSLSWVAVGGGGGESLTNVTVTFSNAPTIWTNPGGAIKFSGSNYVSGLATNGASFVLDTNFDLYLDGDSGSAGVTNGNITASGRLTNTGAILGGGNITNAGGINTANLTNNGTTVLVGNGVVNSNTVPTMRCPIDGVTYTAAWTVGNHSWTGLTNGVQEFEGVGMFTYLTNFAATVGHNYLTNYWLTTNTGHVLMFLQAVGSCATNAVYSTNTLDVNIDLVGFAGSSTNQANFSSISSKNANCASVALSTGAAYWDCSTSQSTNNTAFEEYILVRHMP